jgi:hypothetical protein
VSISASSEASRASWEIVARLELVLPDQPGRDGAADQAPRNKAEGGGGHGEGHRVRETELVLHQLPERRPRSMTAGHGDRAAEKPKKGIDAHPPGQGRAHSGLHQGEHARQNPEDQHLRSADFEQSEARAEADGGEEGDHQRRLERGVELEGQGPGLAQSHRDRREEEAADHGGGDVESIKEPDAAPDRVTHEEQDRGEGQGLDEVELDGLHSESSGRPTSSGRN